jgi:hypothetical protein
LEVKDRDRALPEIVLANIGVYHGSGKICLPEHRWGSVGIRVAVPSLFTRMSEISIATRRARERKESKRWGKAPEKCLPQVVRHSSSNQIDL